MAGGMLLLVIMSTFFAPATLIPLHGAVQLASNGTRALLFHQVLNWKIISAFFIGATFGSGIGSQVVVDIPEAEYRIGLGIFIVLLTWMPKFKSAPQVKAKFALLGVATGFISLFAGATGPLLAPFFIRENLSKEELVGTKAACQMFTHFIKMLVFGFIGFNFAPYLGLLAGMIAAVFLGTYIGKLLLGSLNQRQFSILFKVVITALAFRLVWLGLTQL